MSHVFKIVLAVAVTLGAFLVPAQDAGAGRRIHDGQEPYHGYSPDDPHPRDHVPPRTVRTDAFGRRYFFDPGIGPYRYFDAPGTMYVDEDDDDDALAVIGETILRERIRRLGSASRDPGPPAAGRGSSYVSSHSM